MVLPRVLENCQDNSIHFEGRSTWLLGYPLCMLDVRSCSPRYSGRGDVFIFPGHGRACILGFPLLATPLPEVVQRIKQSSNAEVKFLCSYF